MFEKICNTLLKRWKLSRRQDVVYLPCCFESRRRRLCQKWSRGETNLWSFQNADFTFCETLETLWSHWTGSDNTFLHLHSSRMQVRMWPGRPGSTFTSSSFRGAWGGWSPLTVSLLGGKLANLVWLMIWTRKWTKRSLRENIATC